jgi:hypothetical protein
VQLYLVEEIPEVGVVDVGARAAVRDVIATDTIVRSHAEIVRPARLDDV